MTDASLQTDADQVKAWLGTGSIDIFAPPLAGKDTNAKQLAELLGGAIIGGGDIIRNTPALAELNAKASDGSLVPQDEYLAAVTPYFAKPEFVGKPLILSSVGRWHGEEPAIQQATDTTNHPIRAVIYIKVSEETVRQRLQAAQQLHDRSQRSDDDATKLDKRLEEFRTKTLPVIDYYRQQGLLIEVDGEADRPTVLTAILGKLAHFATQAA